MKIIGISGTNGSGKDTLGHVLAEHHNFLFVSVTDMLRKEAKRRNSPVDRLTLRTISTEWRKAFGLGVLIDKAVDHYNEEKGDYSGLAIASLRNPGEADRVHELGGLVVWVDADPRIRYERIHLNAEARDRAGEDNKTYEEFLAEQQAEMVSTGDIATLSISEVHKRCDITILNNNDGMEVFRTEVEKALAI